MPDQLPLPHFPLYVSAPDEEYMCERQVDHFRKVLQSAKSGLLLDSVPPQAKQNAEEQGEAQKLIKQIDLALRRMEVGEYGYCDGCGVEIGLKWLEEHPLSLLCHDCEMLQDIRRQQERQSV